MQAFSYSSATHCVQAFSVGANFWLKEWTRHSSPTCDVTAGCNKTGSDVIAGHTRQTDPDAESLALTTVSGSTDVSSSNHTVTGRDGKYDSQFYLTIYGVLGIGQGTGNDFSLDKQAVSWP